VWTVERIRALGATTTLPTAAAILGIGRTLAYELVATGTFPTPIIRAGTRVIVPVTPLLKLLHADDDAGSAADSGAADGAADGEQPGGRLDHLGPRRVHATTNHPADSPHRQPVRRIRAHQETDP
jgi:hypothetical protein